MKRFSAVIVLVLIVTLVTSPVFGQAPLITDAVQSAAPSETDPMFRSALIGISQECHLKLDDLVAKFRSRKEGTSAAAIRLIFACIAKIAADEVFEDKKFTQLQDAVAANKAAVARMNQEFDSRAQAITERTVDTEFKSKVIPVVTSVTALATGAESSSKEAKGMVSQVVVGGKTLVAVEKAYFEALRDGKKFPRQAAAEAVKRLECADEELNTPTLCITRPVD